jgi:serine protease inhibitor
MKALFGPETIIPQLDRFVPDIFNPSANPFDFSMSTKKLKEADPSAMGGVCVGTVVHYASFEADHKGAEAKAVTVAVLTYRSLSAEEPPEPIKFHCTKPFGVILIDGPVWGDFSVEFVAKIDEKNVQ